ncbi:MAG: YjbQ family protein [Phycisphaerales bacterium]|nr:YjbQ family protein [Phycisphaerales bacterium]
MTAVLKRLAIRTRGQGLHEVTTEVAAAVRASGVRAGLSTVFVPHTSASLLIQENADPSARRDLERWLAHLVPEEPSRFTHTMEGPDDMPAHIKAALTATTLGIPVEDGHLALGTWQGIYLWEHRHTGSTRRLLVQVLGEQAHGGPA